MAFLYRLVLQVVSWLLPIAAKFNPKINAFVKGRKNLFDNLKEKRTQVSLPIVWVHAASLGEFEQGLPIIKQLRKRNFAVVVSFFSPSGYEVKKNSSDFDLITYLPIDTRENARKFIDILRPEMAIFIKYEFWINYLQELHQRHIPTFLVSGIFRKNQIFFQKYGTFLAEKLRLFDHLFVQNEDSRQLLEKLYIHQVSVTGDTRFDRVQEIVERNNSLDFMERFTENASECWVFGSSWQEDEAIYLPFIQSHKGNTKFVIAPHAIKSEQIHRLKTALQKYKKTLLLSQISSVSYSELVSYEVLIIDTVGLLTRIYSYADIAYVGGGMGSSGLHNVLEPAVFGIPVIIGKNYSKFVEAQDLVEQGGIFSVSNEEEFRLVGGKLASASERVRIGRINQAYIQQKSGATQAFINHLKRHHLL